jgi:hypothetical protein
MTAITTSTAAHPLRRRSIVAGLAAAVVLALPAGASALPSKGRIVPGVSMGGLKIGMTLTQAKKAWGRPTTCNLWKNGDGKWEGSCQWGRHQAVRATIALFAGRVNYMAIEKHGSYPKWKTASGVRLGSSLLKLETAYGTALTDQGAGLFSLTRTYQGYVNETDFRTASNTPVGTDPITMIEIKQGPHA